MRLGDDWQARAAGLEGGDAEGLEVRRRHVEVGPREHVTDLQPGEPTGQRDDVLHAVPAQEPAHGGELGPFPDDDQARPYVVRDEGTSAAKHAQQVQRALPSGQAHDTDQEDVVRPPLPPPGTPAQRVDPVRKDGHGPLRPQDRADGLGGSRADGGPRDRPAPHPEGWCGQPEQR